MALNAVVGAIDDGHIARWEANPNWSPKKDEPRETATHCRKCKLPDGEPEPWPCRAIQRARNEVRHKYGALRPASPKQVA